MAKTRLEIRREKEAWEREWAEIAPPRMREALAHLEALPDPQFTLVLERCLDRLRIIDRRLEDELEAGPAPSRRRLRRLAWPVCDLSCADQSGGLTDQSGGRGSRRAR